MKTFVEFIIKKYRQIFIVAVMFLMLIPLGYVFGIKEKTSLAGKEVYTDLPSLQQKSFLNKDFQTNFEQWWSSHFYARKIALKIKNQLYDWANFNVIHSGYKNNVIQGYDGYLFERGYFASLSYNCMDSNSEGFYKLDMLHKVINSRGGDLYVVLAPNKVLTYKDKLPTRYSFFYNNNCNYYYKIEKKLKQLGIPVYNAQNLAQNIRENEKYEPFSKTGTHWNFYGAGRTVEESLRYFGLADLELKQVDTSLTPYMTERDIADLLNLPVKYYTGEHYPYPRFTKSIVLDGKTSIIGNSFSNEYKRVLFEVLKNKMIIHKGNSPLSNQEAKDILTSKSIFLVYTDQPFFNKQDQLWKKIDILLDNVSDQLIFANSNLSLEQRGLSHVEKWGRWSEGNNVILKFKLENFAIKTKIVFDIRPYINSKHPKLTVDIKNNGKILNTWVFEEGKARPDTSLIITKDMLEDNGCLQLEFDIKDPKSPYELGYSNDKRKLGIGFISVKINSI